MDRESRLKIISAEFQPAQLVEQLVIDRVAGIFFAETEQVAFTPQTDPPEALSLFASFVGPQLKADRRAEIEGQAKRFATRPLGPQTERHPRANLKALAGTRLWNWAGKEPLRSVDEAHASDQR